jgi:hypothetical protein
MRWSETLNPTTFLIYQHRCIAPTNALTQLGNQTGNLLRRLDVSGEQDKTERISGLKESPFDIAQPKPGTAKNNRL